VHRNYESGRAFPYCLSFRDDDDDDDEEDDCAESEQIALRRCCVATQRWSLPRSAGHSVTSMLPVARVARVAVASAARVLIGVRRTDGLSVDWRHLQTFDVLLQHALCPDWDRQHGLASTDPPATSSLHDAAYVPHAPAGLACRRERANTGPNCASAPMQSETR